MNQAFCRVGGAKGGGKGFKGGKGGDRDRRHSPDRDRYDPSDRYDPHGSPEASPYAVSLAQHTDVCTLCSHGLGAATATTALPAATTATTVAALHASESPPHGDAPLHRGCLCSCCMPGQVGAPPHRHFTVLLRWPCRDRDYDRDRDRERNAPPKSRSRCDPQLSAGGDASLPS